MRVAMAYLLAVAMLSVIGAAPAAAGAAAAASRWIYAESEPATGTCAARRMGDEVETLLSFGRDGALLLMAGRPDWQASGPERISLRIDDYQAGPFTATASGNLIVLPIRDATLIGRLARAKNLYWYLPSGQYHADISGLGRALAWLHTCRRDRRAAGSG